MLQIVTIQMMNRILLNLWIGLSLMYVFSQMVLSYGVLVRGVVLVVLAFPTYNYNYCIKFLTYLIFPVNSFRKHCALKTLFIVQ